MVDTSGEVDFRRLERVVGWEVYGEEEDSTGIWTIALYVECCQS